MEQNQINYARTLADGYDNIAPTPIQGEHAWQYAQSDNFFSPEERADVLRRELAPHRAKIEAQLAEVGYPPESLTKFPKFASDLYSGQQTQVVTLLVGSDIELKGRLRVVMTADGPDIRITPVQPGLSIPKEAGSIQLSKAEQQQLSQQGALPRPFMLPDNGSYTPTYLRVDPLTETVELWRIKPEQLPTKLLGIDLTKDQQLQLVNGHSVRLSGLLDKQGEPFNATVSISPARQAIQFTDFNRLNVALRPDNEYRQQVTQNNDGAKTDLIRSRETALGSTTPSHHQNEMATGLAANDPGDQEKSMKMRR
jgi:hypothetical protein